MKILYLMTETPESSELGQLLKSRLQVEGILTIDSYLSTDVTQVMIVKFIPQYDFFIFDGTIEKDAELNSAKYDFLDPAFLKLKNFFVVTRNILPMNIVPYKCNLNQFEALRNAIYQIDRNRLNACNNNIIIPNGDIIDWIQQEINQYTATYGDVERLQTFGNLIREICSTMTYYGQSKKKQIFVSFRGRYQQNEFYGYNIGKVKDWIKNTYHEKDSDEWDEPFTYDSGALSSELMPEQRVWTVQSIISSKIRECNEFWIFETCQEYDSNRNIKHYSYWDSWWCVAEVMEVLQLNTRGLLNEDFKFIIFNPKLPNKVDIIRKDDLPKLTSFEERELMRLKNEGNIELCNLHLRKDKRAFRNAPSFIKKLRYKNLKVRWNIYKQLTGNDISIPFDQYIEDVNCRVYNDSFITQRIYMDPESLEIGRTRYDVLKKDFCKHFLNLVGTYKDTPQYEGIYMITTEDLEDSIKRKRPILVKRNEKGKILTKELAVERYGIMYFFWIPSRKSVCFTRVKRTGPGNSTIQEIPLYKVM